MCPFKIFYEQDLENFLKKNDQKILDFIDNEPENTIINAKEEDYTRLIIEKFSIQSILLNFEGILTSTGKEAVWNGGINSLLQPTGYTKEVINFHIPYEGNEELFYYKPNPFIPWTTEVDIKDNFVCLKIDKTDVDHIKKESESIFNRIKKQYNFLKKQVENYNENLNETVERMFKTRKEKISNKNQILDDLGYPKKTKSSNEIKSNPIEKKEKNQAEQEKIPLIDEKNYQTILDTIFNSGKYIETHKTLYEKQNEEGLRDSLLLGLKQSPKLSATGETFNKKGKTDILVSHVNVTVFIGECKIWSGKKGYLDAITQLFDSYLTWRDSNAAIIIFVKNKRVSSVLKTIEEFTPKHPYFSKYVNNKDASWFNYIMHVKGDLDIEIKLTVLVFHIP